MTPVHVAVGFQNIFRKDGLPENATSSEFRARPSARSIQRKRNALQVIATPP
jgi:hypothetical protein